MPAKIIAVFGLILALAQGVFAQPSQLCVGDYYTEAEGAHKLDQLIKQIRTLGDWQLHADSVRQQIKIGLDLVKVPTKTPLRPKSRGKKVLNGYSVENVVFESFPGFYVSGNLYRPTGQFENKSLAVIATPHGHWRSPENYGRFRQEVQRRCATFAVMGAIVFSYDMIGFGESQQLDHRAEGVAALQTWNTIRIIDFLLTFPEADPSRVAVTGESGGGTQTFLATALDDRIKVSVPVVMVSAHFFGGCTCESGMPIHKTGPKVFTNVEIACLAAPRPMLLVSDGDDWTKNNPKVEFPFAQHIYALYGKPSLVENVHLAGEKHDYGPGKRNAVYNFFEKHLNMSLSKVRNSDGTIREDFVTILDRKALEYFRLEEVSGLITNESVYKAFRDVR